MSSSYNSGDKNDWGTFLSAKEDRPRLSILDNYKQITRIMNATHLMQNESTAGEEAKSNAQQMSSILKSLH